METKKYLRVMIDIKATVILRMLQNAFNRIFMHITEPSSLEFLLKLSQVNFF